MTDIHTDHADHISLGHPSPGRDEFVTIIGADADEISRAFQAEGLAERDFTVMHRMGRHKLTLAGAGLEQALADGREVLVATYTRRTPR